VERLLLFLLDAAKGMASITTRAKPTRSRILACPRMKCRSKPKETSMRLFTRSTAARLA